MAKKRKHSNNNASDFFDYVSGKLSGKDRNAFERRLQKDPFEAEAAEGFAKVSIEEAERDLAHIASRIRSRIRRKRRIVWYSAAAAVASLMIVATIFFTVDDGSMDRYKTAPEFEEAAKEQPSSRSIEPGQIRQDVIPEAEELAKKEVIPDEQELQDEERVKKEEERVKKDELNQDRDLVMKDEERVNKEELNQDRDPVMKDEERVKKEELNQDRDPLMKKGLMQDEKQVMKDEDQLMKDDLMKDDEQVKKEELMQDEYLVNKKDLEQDMFEEKKEAGTKDAAQLSKLAAQATPDEPVIREFQQDEIPELEEMQPAQVNALEEEMPQQVQEVTIKPAASETLRGQVQEVTSEQAMTSKQAMTSEQAMTSKQAMTSEQAASQVFQGQVQGVHISEPRQDEIPELEEMQQAQVNALEKKIPQQVQVRAIENEETEKMLTIAVTTVAPDPVTDSDYISASPVNGIIQYNRYMDTTLVYPPAAETGDREVVVLTFTITADGRPENFRVVRSPGEPFTEEAIRVISNGPDWNPATRDGTYVDDEVRLRIVFRPE